MPFTALLIVPRHGQAIERLQACLPLKTALSSAYVQDGLLHADVLPLLVTQNLYGHVFDVDPSNTALWATADAESVLFEGDLGSNEFSGYIGTWSIQFLKWLKLISKATNEEVSIEYEHERGDYMYEYAWWSSNPGSTDGEVETFGIQSHDGMNDPQWRREAVRFADGHVEIHDELPGRHAAPDA